MIRTAVVTAMAIGLAVVAVPGYDLFGEEQKEAEPTSGKEAQVSNEVQKKLDAVEQELLESMMRKRYRRQLLGDANLESSLPVPKNWQPHTDSTGDKSYFVPLIETEETIAYQALIDYLKQLSPAESKPELLNLSVE